MQNGKSQVESYLPEMIKHTNLQHQADAQTPHILLTCMNRRLDSLQGASGALQERRVQTVQPKVLHNRQRNAGTAGSGSSHSQAGAGAPLSSSVCTGETPELSFMLRTHIPESDIQNKPNTEQ